MASAAEVPKFYFIADPDQYFTGREDYLDRIDSRLLECSKEKKWRNKIVLIHGIGGMGKSEIVRRYVERHMERPTPERLFQSVAWINAETNESAKDSFTKLAKKIKIFYEKMKVEEIAENFYEYYSDNIEKIKSGLLIFDNVEQIASQDQSSSSKDQDQRLYFGILNLLPRNLPSNLNCPLIIITSRMELDVRIKENIIQINGLSDQESEEFLKVRFNSKDGQEPGEEAIKKLLDEIQGYPLALSLAASNIGTRNVSNEMITNYITELNKPASGWFSHKKKVGGDTDYMFTMEKVWDTTFRKIQFVEPKGEFSLQLLIFLAYLPSDLLDTDDIRRIAKFWFGTENNVSEGLATLENYSLIKKCGENAEQIQIHRHVQRCTREKLEYSKDYSYLFAVCLYSTPYCFSSDIMLHNHLKERNWPHGSISLSIILISRVRSYNGQKKFSTFQDVNNWIVNHQNCSILSENISLLFDAWRFYFSLPVGFRETVCQIPSQSFPFLQKRFESFTKLFVENIDLTWFKQIQQTSSDSARVINLNESPLQLREVCQFLKSESTAPARNKNVQQSKEDIGFPRFPFKGPWNNEDKNTVSCSADNLEKEEFTPPVLVDESFITTCWFDIMKICFPELNESVQKKVCKTICKAFESYCPDSRIKEYFGIIETFCDAFEYIIGRNTVCLYMEAVIKKHFVFYPTLKRHFDCETVDENERFDQHYYWRRKLLNYQTILDCWDCKAEGSELIPDSFFEAGGQKCLADHLRFLAIWDPDYNSDFEDEDCCYLFC